MTNGSGRPSAWVFRALTGAGLLLLSVTVSAGTQIYKCVKDGQTTLTDKPCDKPADPAAPSSAPMTSVPSSTSPSPNGKWSGQMQYSAVESGQPLEAAHSVALISAEFSADGKVSGASPENGCRILGVWSAGSTPTLFWVDFATRECRFQSFNRRFNGSFILAKPDSSGTVQVQAGEQPRPGQGARMYDIKGTLRR